MWQVVCEVGNGQTGKLVTGSWLKAAIQYVVWRVKGRATSIERYDPKGPLRRSSDSFGGP